MTSRKKSQVNGSHSYESYSTIELSNLLKSCEIKKEEITKEERKIMEVYRRRVGH